jgi:cytoskeletal protein CcmA (bactofilin family)
MAPAISSVLSESTSIRGKVHGEGDLEVRGRIEGVVDVTGQLVIADGALIRANVRGGRVVIRGAVVGDVSATEAIVLEDSARVVGNLTADRIAIALGAQIRGQLTMDVGMGEEGARRPAARAAAAPAKPMARREPLPPARSVFATRKAPVAAESRAHTSAKEAVAPKAPPAPVVPSIKKGAKASPKKKGA